MQTFNVFILKNHEAHGLDYTVPRMGCIVLKIILKTVGKSVALKQNSKRSEIIPAVTHETTRA